MASLHLNFYWGIITTLNYSPIHLALNHPTPCYPHACQVFVNTDTCTAAMTLCDVTAATRRSRAANGKPRLERQDMVGAWFCTRPNT